MSCSFNRCLLCLALSSTVLLSACGFKLRGSLLGDNLPFKNIYLEIPQNSTLGAELRRNIRGSGELRIAKRLEDAEAILDIPAEVREKYILSLNRQGRVREYVLYYRVTVRVRDRNNIVLLAPTQISLKRDMTYNENQVLAKEGEEVILYRDMQLDIVQQILRCFSSIERVTTIAPEGTK